MVKKQIDILVKFTSNFAQVGKRLIQNMRRLYFYIFRFRMEMLSVLFFGMALQRFFVGLLKPSFQLAGIFEMLTNILQLFFLPVALALIDPLLTLMDAMLNMSDETKLAIGKFVLLGAAFGTIMMAVGIFVLGIMGLLTILTSLAIKAGIFWAILKVLDLLGFQATDKVKAGFNKILTALDALWESFLDLTPVKNFLTQLGLTDETIRKLKDPIKFIKDKVREMWDDLKEKFKGWTDEFKAEWMMFKLDVIRLFFAIKDAYDSTIGALKLPEFLKNIYERKVSVIAGAAVGGAIAGPGGAIAGGALGYLSDATGARLAAGLERLASLFETAGVIPIPGGVYPPGLYEETERQGGT